MISPSDPQSAAGGRALVPLTIGIDASRSRSGGAVAHLRGLIESGNPLSCGIERVHLWGHDDLLNSIRAPAWLTVHRVLETQRSTARQLWWQYAKLPALARKLGVNVMFNSDAGSVCPFQLSATLSQDLLSFEPGEMQRYPWFGRARLRLEILKIVQLRQLKRSTLAIFLTEHARSVIGDQVDLPSSVVIPHGVDQKFRSVSSHRRAWPADGPIECLYVSNAAPYKHQWHVIEAVACVRQSSRYDLRLRLIGGGSGTAMKRLKAALERFDPTGAFVKLVDFAPHDSIPGELADADLFIFASSCENLPITLLEAMAAGLPICSSDRGPMPEVLGPHASFFNPEIPATIAASLLSVLDDAVHREKLRADALLRASRYTWEACADATWAALANLKAPASR